MKLIKCPLCGKTISNEAPHCPDCGHPIAGKKTEATAGISAIIVMTGIGLTCWLMFKLASEMNSMGLAIGLSLIPTVAAFVFASLRKK